MKKEIETKFDVPLELDVNGTLSKLKAIINEEGFSVTASIIEHRTFQYYDTSNLDVYKKGETIRRVSGFKKGEDKALHRYDFKVGALDDRYEANQWSNDLLTSPEILERLNLKKFYAVIIPSAFANTQHDKMKLKKDETLIELTIDYFKVDEGGEFRELELELEHGSASDLKVLSEKIKINLDLKEINQQKYSRVIESMPKYRTQVISLS